MARDSGVNDGGGDGGAADGAAPACPLVVPTSGRIPGLLALAALPAAVLIKPLFFSLAGGLLAMLSLLLAPAGGRCLGVLGLVGAIATAVFAALMTR